MNNLRLSSSASITLTDVGVLLRSDLGTFQLTGSDLKVFISKIVPMLDGMLTKEEIADALPGYERGSIFQVLDLLLQTGLVKVIADQQESSQRWRGQHEFFRKWTSQPEEAIQKLQSARILIVGLEPWGVVVASELASAGVATIHLIDDGIVSEDDLLSVRIWDSDQLGRSRREALQGALGRLAPWCRVTIQPLHLDDNRQILVDGTNWNLVIVATTGDDLMVLRAVALYAQRTSLMSLYGSLEGMEAVVGPAVIPGRTPCWNCTRLRLLANSDIPEPAHALQASLLQQRSQPRIRTYLAPMPPLLGHFLATEAIKLITEYTPSRLVGKLLIQNLIDLETSYHSVIRMPWCEVCGSSDRDAFRAGGTVLDDLTEESAIDIGKKKLTDCSNPEELRRGLAGWVDERTGIIRYLALNAPDDMGPDLPLTSTAVLSNYTEGEFRRQDLSLGSGKGLTDLQAMIGAVGEAIERYSASRYHGDSLIHCPMHDLPGDYLDPRDLGLYDEHQYAVDGFPFVRFDPAQSIHWTQGTWLDSRKPVWLPALPTYFNFRTPRNEQFCQVSSNGLAAGMSLADASLRAIFELVERDAFMISWHCRLPGQRIELDKSLGVGVLEIVRQLKELGAQIELYWMTAGIAIPVVACLGVGDGVHWPGVSVSLAAHASIGTAAHKAILEQGAIGPYIRRMMMDGLPIPDTPEDVHSLNDHALFYVPIERRVAFDFLRTDSSNAVLLSDVEVPHEASLVWCAEHLARGGVRVAIADVTSSDLSGSGFAVARALGTSIQSIDFGFNLRRLTNPRLKQQLTSEPNPFPHPLA